MADVNENRPVRPRIQNIDKLSQSELFHIVRNEKSSSSSQLIDEECKKV